MNKKIACFSLLALALSHSACIADSTGTADSTGEASDGELTDEAASELVHDVILRNVATGRCLDSNADGHVYTLSCNGGPFQKWVFNGPLLWTNQATHLCLEDLIGTGAVRTRSCNPLPYQSWILIKREGHGYEIVNRATGRCLDSNADGHVYTLSCNGGPFQRWY